jgi:hypothetical protein
MKFARRAIALSRARSLPLPALSTACVALIFGAILTFGATPAMAAGSSAQSGAGAEAADAAALVAAPSKAETTKTEATKTEAKKAEAGKADPSKATPNKGKPATVAHQVMPEPKALPPNLSGECAWTGKRIVSLLARDDVDQAKRFLEFYRLFACKETHIAPTFRCVIASEQENAPSEEFADRVDRCWDEMD